MKFLIPTYLVTIIFFSNIWFDVFRKNRQKRTAKAIEELNTFPAEDWVLPIAPVEVPNETTLLRAGTTTDGEFRPH